MVRKPYLNPYHHCQRAVFPDPLPLSAKSHSSPWPLQPVRHTRKVGNLQAFLNSQITQRGREGNIKEARSIFDSMPSRNVITWTAMLTAYADNYDICNARKVFEQMPERNAPAWNAMISAYARDPNLLSKSYELFRTMPIKNSVTYGAMITGFARAGLILQAEEVYKSMPINWRDPIGSTALISAYLRAGEIEKAESVFQGMMFKDVFSWSLMVEGYCKEGMILEAREAFEAMPVKNVVSWTSMIRGYIKIGDFEESFSLFSRMKKASVNVNSRTLAVLLDGCTELCRTKEGCQVHGMAVAMGFEQDVFLANTLIVMYFKDDSIDASRRIFDSMSYRDVVSWNSLIAGYVERYKMEEAYTLFESMPEKDVVSWTSMVAGFAKKGWTEESISLFEMMPQKDEVSWTALVSGLAHNGKLELACHWFSNLLREGIKPNRAVLSSMLSSLADLTKLKEGRQLHACVVKMCLEPDIYILSSLISMYSKCGNLSEAYECFSGISTSNIVCINSMITAFANHGLAQEAFYLFRKIQEDGHKLTDVTFLAILTACSHAGLIEEANYYFKLMRSEYGIEPGPNHYTCMVDMLGRAGLLHEALDLIKSIPDGTQSMAWGAMLSASGLHSDSNMGNLAAQKLFELEPESATPYAVLSTIYANVGKKEDEISVRLEKHVKGVKKSPGCSWVSMDGVSINAHG